MEYNIDEILILVKKKMIEQGGFTREAYKEYIDETIGYFLEKGKLSEEDNLGLIKSNLLEMWPEVEEQIIKIK